MTPQQMNTLPEAAPISTICRPKIERIVVRTGDGREFDLGSPDALLFPLRRAFYLWKRRKELKPCK